MASAVFSGWKTPKVAVCSATAVRPAPVRARIASERRGFGRVTDTINKKAQVIVADARKRAAAKWGAGWAHHKRAEISLLVVGAINVCDLTELTVDTQARLAMTWQRACELALQEV